ncbi:hypothetical protein BCR44DRAFT_23921 [Catenaria anguillulae PL171]|uniref:ABC transporter domain-containing protein n=1 Tax=Catenaria anguillulae PL171 TaxID=765915 RepID=A0A1Y2HKU9_9FUNG|nr:hypothetical protein BCR44DRAFT_23921 [Catenaria anguillulae PL171]
MSKYKVRIRRSAWRQLAALCRKNYLVKSRDRMPWIMSLVMPLYMLAILWVLSAATGNAGRAPSLNALPKLAEEGKTCVNVPADKCVHIAYTNTTNVDPVIENLVSLAAASEKPNPIIIRNFESASAIREYFDANPGALVSGVDFLNVSAVTTFPFTDPNAITFPRELATVSYSIYTNISALIMSTPLRQRFVTTQLYVERALINTRRQMFALPPLEAPLAAPANDPLGFPLFTWMNTMEQRGMSVTVLFQFYFVFMLSSMWTNVLRDVATEKQNKIREILTVQGLTSPVYMTAVFITQFLTDAPTMLIVTLISTLTQMFPNTNFLLFLVASLLYLATCTLTGLLLSVYINDPKRAESTGQIYAILVLALYGVGLALVFDTGFTSTGFNKPAYEWLMYLVAPVTYARLIALFMHRETILLPTTLSTFTETQIPLLLGFLALDIVLYAVLVWYLDQVSIGLPANFPFRAEYWNDGGDSGKSEAELLRVTPEALPEPDTVNDDATVVRMPGFADEVKQRGAAISVRRLVKEFPIVESTAAADSGPKSGTKAGVKRAVNGLSLDVPRGTVFGLLGRNGEGKSTSINLMTGLLPATAGDVSVLGTKVTNLTIRAVQRQLGLCPQHDVLWATLTCLEHLQIVAEIRGVEVEQGGSLHEYLMQLLQDVYLQTRADDASAGLSGGMKRKLSVAMSLLGSPPIVILDEPTTGMDVYTRQHVWSLIQDTRKHSTVLLTSHSMEEIEAVSDNVAIISAGRLRSLGTPLYLKNKFGAGYRFVAERVPGSTTFSAARLLGALKDKFADSVVTVESETPASVTLRIAIKDAGDRKVTDAVSKFFDKWDELNDRYQLGVASIGFGVVTLEDVFIQLNDEWEREAKAASAPEA